MTDERLQQLFAWWNEDDAARNVVAEVWDDYDFEKLQCQFYKCPPAITTREQFLRWVERVATEYETRALVFRTARCMRRLTTEMVAGLKQVYGSELGLKPPVPFPPIEIYNGVAFIELKNRKGTSHILKTPAEHLEWLRAAWPFCVVVVGRKKIVYKYGTIENFKTGIRSRHDTQLHKLAMAYKYHDESTDRLMIRSIDGDWLNWCGLFIPALERDGQWYERAQAEFETIKASRRGAGLVQLKRDKNDQYLLPALESDWEGNSSSRPVSTRPTDEFGESLSEIEDVGTQLHIPGSYAGSEAKELGEHGTAYV